MRLLAQSVGNGEPLEKPLQLSAGDAAERVDKESKLVMLCICRMWHTAAFRVAARAGELVGRWAF